MTHPVKAWLSERRNTLVSERDRIQARIDQLNLLIAEADDMRFPEEVIPEFTTGVKSNGMYVMEGLPPRKNRRAYVPTRYEAPTTEMAMTALQAAGEKGLTARELAEVAGMPIGTASGRLTVLKTQGVVMHVQPRYFVVHSDPQDNNQ